LCAAAKQLWTTGLGSGNPATLSDQQVSGFDAVGCRAAAAGQNEMKQQSGLTADATSLEG